jgi:hypothetical protein
MAKVARYVELSVGLPMAAEHIVHRALPKSLEAQQALLQQVTQARVVQAIAERQHADDRHEIGGTFHPQPREVHGAHGFAGWVHGGDKRMMPGEDREGLELSVEWQ